MLTVDLNCDMGEGYGNDAELMKLVSSANIACGFHAGDEETMHRTVRLAVENSVAIGAHPGYRDRENFGRLERQVSSNEAFDLITEQIAIMTRVCQEYGVNLHHVKPHGALYNQAAKDIELAAAICSAVASVDPSLILYGLSGSALISEAQRAGLLTASEVFSDRTYRPDGSLTPRTASNALIDIESQAVAQVMQMIESRSVTAVTGENVPIDVDTVCIHGDGPHAIQFAVTLRHALAARGIAIGSPQQITDY